MKWAPDWIKEPTNAGDMATRDQQDGKSRDRVGGSLGPVGEAPECTPGHPGSGSIIVCIRDPIRGTDCWTTPDLTPRERLNLTSILYGRYPEGSLARQMETAAAQNAIAYGRKIEFPGSKPKRPKVVKKPSGPTLIKGIHQ